MSSSIKLYLDVFSAQKIYIIEKNIFKFKPVKKVEPKNCDIIKSVTYQQELQFHIFLINFEFPQCKSQSKPESILKNTKKYTEVVFMATNANDSS